MGANGKDSLLSIEQMVDVRDVEMIDVPVKEWGGTLKLATVSAAEMLEWSEDTDDSTPEGKIRAKTGGLRLFLRSLVDSEGNRIVARTSEEDLVVKFSKKNTRVLNRVVGEALRLNGIRTARQASLEAAKEALEAAKNALSEAPTGASPTGSPSSSDTPAPTIS